MDAPVVVARHTETNSEGRRQSGLAAPTARDDAVAQVFRTPEVPENRETYMEREEERETEYDAEAVASLLWPDDNPPQREWVDGPIDQVLSCEASSSSPSARRRRSSGSIVDALVNASIADEAQTVECDALRSQAKQEEQRRQLDALELQLAKLEAEKRVLCSELGPARTKARDALHPSRLRASAANTTRGDGELAHDGPKHQDSSAPSAVNKHDIEVPREVQPHRIAQKYPTAFICPITQDIFRFPVIASDGHSYERQAIETWLVSTKAAPTSPVTNLPLPTTALFPNHGLRSQVLEWREKEGLPSDDFTAAGAQSEKGYAGLVDACLRTPLCADDTDTNTDDSDDDADPFDLALSEALRRSLIDQQMSTSGHLVWHHSQWNAIETSHVAELMRARRARGLRPAADTTGSPTLYRDDLATYGGNTQHRRSSACTVM